MEQVVEIWLPIKEWEGYYEVSNLGQVRSVPRIVVFKDGRVAKYKGRILRTGINSDGYMCAGMSKNGTQVNQSVHGLVGHHFVKGYEPGLELNHISGNKLNNAYWNLEWGTHQHNMYHAIATGLFKPGTYAPISENMRTASVLARGKKVINTVTLEEYRSVREAAKTMNMYQATLSDMLNGKVTNRTNLKYISACEV